VRATDIDEFVEAAPVGCFPPNGYGLYDDRQLLGMDQRLVPVGSHEGDGNQPELVSVHVSQGQSPSRVIKDGSYLCSMNYCSRYRPAARQPQETDLAAAHLGFRTVLSKLSP
jgi:formylglycine-generating enzyme required for sulfatase activity